jgi:hypothetical protein
MRYVLLCSLIVAAPARGDTPLNETRSALEKWFEARQLSSRAKSDWQSDREMLQQTTALLERELKALEEQFTKLGTNSTQVERERLQAEALLKSSNDGLEEARHFATEFEPKVMKLAPQLPVPLQEILKPLLDRIPEDPANTKMLSTERVQVLVGILNELDKFNSAISVFSERRKNKRSEEVAVESVYVGLGAAYFVNEMGDFAGTGMPGPEGWEWTVKPEIAPSVREVIRIYRNERPAKFVSLPAQVR